MSHQHQFSRRDMLRTALTAGAVLAAPAVVRGATCTMTPGQVEGPFYMNSYDRTVKFENQNDLTRVPGAPRAADGEVIYLAGQVTDRDCKPVKGVTVEIWQSCATGRYAHVMDPNPAKLDPYFGYFGQFMTDEEGRYSFKTIKPAAYPIPGGLTRPAHVHFKLTGFIPVLITQMYFAGDPYNKSDILLGAVTKPEQKRLIIEPSRRPGSSEENLYQFDLVAGTFDFSLTGEN